MLVLPNQYDADISRHKTFKKVASHGEGAFRAGKYTYGEKTVGLSWLALLRAVFVRAVFELFEKIIAI